MSESVEKEEVGLEVSPVLSPGKSVPVDKASYSVGNGHSPCENRDGQGSEKLESGIVDSAFIIGSKGQDSEVPLQKSEKLESGNVDSALVIGSKGQDSEVPLQKSDVLVDTTVSDSDPEAMGAALVDKVDESEMAETKNGGDDNTVPSVGVVSADEMMKIEKEVEIPVPKEKGNLSLKDLFLLDENDEGSDSGTEEDQSAFMKELENFFKEKGMEFKPPKFYGEGLNCLKLWRAVIRLGGYEKVTSCKLWRQVGESFRPPKTCTTVSWTFRGFYEKALLDYEKDKIHGGELNLSVASPTATPNVDNQAPGSNRARRDSAARAMQGWSSQRLLSSGEAGDPITKDKNAKSLQKREKQLKSISSLKRKKPSNSENAADAAKSMCTESSTKVHVPVVDMGPPADWVKINVQRSKDCFEVYALVPGLLREEVRVQSDPAGRLVISGEPENLDNPWGVTPFKKVLNLPSRIDPHHTSAVVTLHGQLYVRVPFEQLET